MKKTTILIMLTGIIMAASHVGATLLDFNISYGAPGETFEHGGTTSNGYWNPAIHTAYGSRVATNGALEITLRDPEGDWWRLRTATYAVETSEGYTPNIATTYDIVNTKYQRGAYKGLTNAVVLTGTTTSGDVTGKVIGFVPDADYSVKIHSFDMVVWSYATRQLGAVEIIQASDSNIVWSANPGGDVSIAIVKTTFTPNFTGEFGEEYYIKLTDGVSSTVNYFGMDNILFSQMEAPIPATLVLVIISGAGMLFFRRFRR